MVWTALLASWRETMIHEVKGDLLEAPQLVLAHQANCQGVMDAGLAKQIRKRWPSVYEEYRRSCEILGLGRVVFVDTGDHWIANMLAQYDFGRGRRFTDYEAFASCCTKLVQFLKCRDLTEIAFPKCVGCGLAGGNWNVIKAIIESELGEFEVYFYGL